MSQPYVGQIIMFGGNFAPAGWMTCSGQIVPITNFETLFNLIGTTYGGDGQSTFALPDLRSRVAMHMGGGFSLAQNGGSETVTLTTNQIPQHTHLVTTRSGGPGNSNTPATNIVMADAQVSIGTDIPNPYAPYNSGTPAQVTLPASSIGNAGGSQPHENIQPVMAITYIISLFGVFPSQN